MHVELVGNTGFSAVTLSLAQYLKQLSRRSSNTRNQLPDQQNLRTYTSVFDRRAEKDRTKRMLRVTRT